MYTRCGFAADAETTSTASPASDSVARMATRMRTSWLSQMLCVGRTRPVRARRELRKRCASQQAAAEFAKTRPLGLPFLDDEVTPVSRCTSDTSTCGAAHLWLSGFEKEEFQQEI